MLTDSRSFLSYPRHEYFRRILCRILGGWVADGQAPADYDLLGRMVTDICCRNAARYLGMGGEGRPPPLRAAHLEVCCENVRRCAKYGAKCVTYTFMPVFDRSRAQLEQRAPTAPPA